jgi:hypothetical protein
MKRARWRRGRLSVTTFRPLSFSRSDESRRFLTQRLNYTLCRAECANHLPKRPQARNFVKPLSIFTEKFDYTLRNRLRTSGRVVGFSRA